MTPVARSFALRFTPGASAELKSVTVPRISPVLRTCGAANGASAVRASIRTVARFVGIRNFLAVAGPRHYCRGSETAARFCDARIATAGLPYSFVEQPLQSPF